jgi:MFS family permease
MSSTVREVSGPDGPDEQLATSSPDGAGGWQSVFYINVPIAAIALAVGLLVLAESRAEQREHLDLPGVVLLAAGLFAIVFGLIKAQAWGWGDAKTIGFIAGGLVLLAVFAVTEARTRMPLLPMRLFASRSLSIGTITTLIGFLALLPVVPHVPGHIQAAIVSGSHQAFMTGLHTSLTVAAITALAVAALALFVRRGAAGGGAGLVI